MNMLAVSLRRAETRTLRMILNRQHFDINNRCVIEKVTVRTPMRYIRIFPNEACFLHFKRGQLNLASATGKTQIEITIEGIIRDRGGAPSTTLATRHCSHSSIAISTAASTHSIQ